MTPLTKTTVNRFFLFILIGFTSTLPFLLLSFVLAAFWAVILVPLVVLIVLIFKTAKEKRVSKVKPKWLELFLSAVGAIYPSVLTAIVLWLVRWALYGSAVLIGLDGEYKGAAYNFANAVFVLLLLGSIVFLVSMNWQHLLNQLYPKVGSQSAFAQISTTGKTWLIKRGAALSLIFIFLFLVILIVGPQMSEGGALNIRNEFVAGLFLVFLYLFLVSLSAWLWLSEPEMPRGIEITNEALVRLLQPMGYHVQALSDMRTDSIQKADFSEQMTASIDLVARKEEQSLVIDVITAKETQHALDWVIASEFQMAVLYLKNILQLSTPVKTVTVLVDVAADDSWFRYAEDQNIVVIQLSGEEVIALMTANLSDSALQNKFASLFSPSMVNTMNEPRPLNVQVLEDGGRHG